MPILCNTSYYIRSLWYIPAGCLQLAGMNISPAPCLIMSVQLSRWVGRWLAFWPTWPALKLGKKGLLSSLWLGSGFPNEVGRLPNTRPHPPITRPKMTTLPWDPHDKQAHTHTHTISYCHIRQTLPRDGYANGNL